MRKYEVDPKTLTIIEVEDFLFDSIEDARDCLWDFIFARHREDAEIYRKLPDAKPEEFMEWLTEWKWREDVDRATKWMYQRSQIEELKKHGDYNAPKTEN